MDELRKDFPLLVENPNLIYFDNAATTLKPKGVVDAVIDYYTKYSANIHRGDYRISIEASEKYDQVREKVALFINAPVDTIIYTSGTSDSLNLVAFGYGMQHLTQGDVILLNEGEHASNILPWFEVARHTGAIIEYIPFDSQHEMTVQSFERAMHEKVKIVSIAHISNVLGYINDVKCIAEIVHRHNALLCVDGAQSVGHMRVDVTDMDVDFFAFSSHKMCGPSGVGILYGKMKYLNMMNPLRFGGGSNARFTKTGALILKDVPERFETGTPNIEGILGFGAAVDYLMKCDFNAFHKHETMLREVLVKGLDSIDHITVYNPDANASIISLNVDGIFSQDVAAYLDSFGICVRAGNHCSKLSSGVFGVENTVRVSLYFYNTLYEVQRFLEVIKSINLERVVSLYV